jgi:hypothetical protein
VTTQLQPYVDGFAIVPATWVNPDTGARQASQVLLDSGSRTSSVDERIARALNAAPVGSTTVIGADGVPFRARLYVLNLLTPVGDVLRHPFWGLPAGLGLGGLVGEDILAHGLFEERPEGWYAAIGTAAPAQTTRWADGLLVGGVAAALLAVYLGTRGAA